MLTLKGITKEYPVGNGTVRALRGIDLIFRKSEFVSVLGPSGCGKTTLLNIIGGLDQYTQGDLIVNGVSTSRYRDPDWDAYRNNSVGFVFQNYNLIPHQTVLVNVELALTLSGVSKAERRRKAAAALERVGLGDQLKKNPNQLSGGQMQRVAIARALVNDPEILLADEPTGALDTETSTQVLDILKEISADRLVIMVTHNSELAEHYSTRIVRLLDGLVTGDTDPFDGSEAPNEPSVAGGLNAPKTAKKKSMSFYTALTLSLNNLMTKKTRTFMTAFAGSIGIIGIALILSLSNGIQKYIDRIQSDTLSAYPITISAETVDMAGILSSMREDQDGEISHDRDAVYSGSYMADMFDTMLSIDTKTNNLQAFLEYVQSEESGMSEYIGSIQYKYGTTLNIYASDTSNGIVKVNPSPVIDNLMSTFYNTDTLSASPVSSIMGISSGFDIWTELIDDKELLESQFDLIAGRWPSSYDEVVLIVDENNEISDIFLYSLGLMDQSEVQEMLQAALAGKKIEPKTESWTYEELLGTTYKLVLPTDYYVYHSETGTWTDNSINADYMTYLIDSAGQLSVVGIIRPGENAVATAVTGAVGYTGDLVRHVVETINERKIVKEQQNDKATDVFTGLPFADSSSTVLTDSEKAAEFSDFAKTLTVTEKAAIFARIGSVPTQKEINDKVAEVMNGMTREKAEQLFIKGYAARMGVDEESAASYIASMTDENLFRFIETGLSEDIRSSYAESFEQAVSSMTSEELAAAFDARVAASDEASLAALYDENMSAGVSESTLEENLALLGVSDLDKPASVNIYARTFRDKDSITEKIAEYNEKMSAQGREDLVIRYTDYVGLLISSITTIINIISYVLIAFVSISLVVSSIMIGVITYISVLERTKEIGILRSIGASKRDISRVFNAETMIIGFTSGAIGIILAALLCIPASAIVKNLTGVSGIAQLPLSGALALVLISIVLTLISGLIPSRIAARKDPVVALRTE
ncbi:MAG: ABC transporter ATP-binding protein/permease [Clostridiales bacterium]|nr:ABC transporter ATP-binding protein/permease [Clostridiales bacterium]